MRYDLQPQERKEKDRDKGGWGGGVGFAIGAALRVFVLIHPRRVGDLHVGNGW